MLKINQPIIFLDMDGVMNNDESLIRSTKGFHPPGNISAMTVSHMCVANLKYLVEKTNAEIVISSSWRSGRMDDLEFKNKYGNLAVLRALEWADFSCKHLIIGNTPRLDSDRGSEIELWQSLRADRFIKNVTPFVILDDDDDLTNIQKGKHFVQTDGQRGFQLKDLELAIDIIQRQIAKPY